MPVATLAAASSRAARPTRRAGEPGRLGAWLLVAPALLFFVVLFLVPLALMLVMSLLDGNPGGRRPVGLTLANYALLLEDSYHLEALGATLELAAWVTLWSLVLAYPLAYQLVRLRSAVWRTAFLVAILSPMLTGLVIRAYAWMTILADQGVINQSLRLVGLTDAPLPLMYNQFGIAVAMVHVFVPFMVLTLLGVLGRIDPRLEQAARSLGASRGRAFLEVTLPLSLPGIVAGSVLVFSLSVSSYVTPTLLGGFQFINLPVLIYQQIASSFNPRLASALGFVLLLVSLLLVVAYWRALQGVVKGVRA